MNVKVINVLIILLIIFCGVMCNKDDSSSLFLGKKIILPDSLERLNDGAKEFKHIEGQPTLVTVVKASCASCIHEMKVWKQLINKGAFNKKWNYYFLAEGQPIFYFSENVLNREYLQELPIFLDKKGSFIEQNRLESISHHGTFVLNKKGTLIFYGSPYVDTANVDKIRKKLNSH